MKKDLAHKAAIRGMSWDHSNRFTLFTGGGADDQSIKKWNVLSLREESVKNTGS